jgi:hypothetical protein
MVPMHDPCRTAFGAIAALEHVLTAAELELKILNERDVPRAHLGVTQERCSPSTQPVKVPVMQLQMDARLRTSVQEQLEVRALLGRRRGLVYWGVY